MLIDSHAHLNFEDFKDDWQQVVADCQKNNIWLINVGSQLQTSQKAIEIARQYDQGVYVAVGLHPIHVVGSEFHPEEFILDDYRKLIKTSKKIVAIGETGLDFYHDHKNVESQKEIFVKHLNLAKEFSLPVILHSRNSKDGKDNAYDEILSEIRKPASASRPIRHAQGRPEFTEGRQDRGFGELRGVTHCFGGTLEQAKEFLNLGFYLGFTGVITFPKTEALAEIIKILPLDRILVETDSPYLAPIPFRGQRNLPQYVRLVAEKIAEIKQMDYNKVVKQTAENAIKLFNLPC